MNIFENNRDATMEDLASMKYLENCIKEILRLYPPVPFISRKITEDVKLSMLLYISIPIMSIIVRDIVFKISYTYYRNQHFAL